MRPGLTSATYAADDSSLDSEDEELAEAAIAAWLSGRSSTSAGPYLHDGAGPSSDSDTSVQELQPTVVSDRAKQATCDASADLEAKTAAPAAAQTGSIQGSMENTAQPRAGANLHGASESAAALSPPVERSTAKPALDAHAAGGQKVPANGDAAAASDSSALQQVDTKLEPISLQNYGSATELMELGLDVLKQQLQLHGLKCGGNLAERAARLFLLKDTPLTDLDKKHFPKNRK